MKKQLIYLEGGNPPMCPGLFYEDEQTGNMDRIAFIPAGIRGSLEASACRSIEIEYQATGAIVGLDRVREIMKNSRT